MAGQIAGLLRAAQFSHAPITAAAANPLLASGQHLLQRAISTEENCS